MGLGGYNGVSEKKKFQYNNIHYNDSIINSGNKAWPRGLCLFMYFDFPLFIGSTRCCPYYDLLNSPIIGGKKHSTSFFKYNLGSINFSRGLTLMYSKVC